MRKLLLSVIVVAALLTSFSAVAEDQSLTGCAQIPCAGDLAKHPWSSGIFIGFSALDYTGNGGYSTVAFAMEIPLEYAFVVGPGNLVAHFSFMLDAKSGFTSITFPFGARYKMQILQKYPLYVYPLFDIGPAISIVNSNSKAGGWIRFGGGVSYLVLPWLEVQFEPLGLGAVFDANNSAFVYTFLLGAQAHF
jgi:hypothetical protein